MKPLTINNKKRRRAATTTTPTNQQQQQRRRRQRLSIEVCIKSFVIILAFIVIYGNYSMLFDNDLEEIFLNNVSSSLSAVEASKKSLPLQPSSSSSSSQKQSPKQKGSNNNEQKNNDGDNNNNKIRNILRAANVTITTEDEKTLPTWDEVISRFGSKPIIDGLETCASFNSRVPIQKRHIGIAGTFNSGTNLLAQTLTANCRMRGKTNPKNGKFIEEGIQWQVNWGKHTPIQFRQQNRIHPHLINEHMLPIVMIRDPWSWMQSMCRVRYSAHWYHVVAPDNPDGQQKSIEEYPHHCPNLIANDIDKQFIDKNKPWLHKYYNGDPWKIDNISDKANYTLATKVIPLWVRYKSGNINHKSLIHMWIDWYAEYYKAKFDDISNNKENNNNIPRLIVRLEDLVFHPTETLQQICDCVEGQFLPSSSSSAAESTTTTTDGNQQQQQQQKKKQDLILVPESAKGGVNDEHIHGKNQSNLLSAMISHLRLNRTKGMTTDDIQFVLDALKQQNGTESGGIDDNNHEQSIINLMKTFGYSHPDVALN